MKPKIIIFLLLLAGSGTQAKAYDINAVVQYIKEVIAGIYTAQSLSKDREPTEQVVSLACERSFAGKITCDSVVNSLSGDSLQIFSLSQEQPMLTLWPILGVAWGVMICDMIRLIQYRWIYYDNSLLATEGLPQLLLGTNVMRAVRQLRDLLMQHLLFSNKVSDFVVCTLLIMLKWTLLGGLGGVSASLICRLINPTEEEVLLFIKITHHQAITEGLESTDSVTSSQRASLLSEMQ